MRNLLILIFVIAIYQVGNSQYLAPDWVRQCPTGRYINYYFCGNGVHRDFRTAGEIALTIALKKFESNYALFSLTEIDKTPRYDNSRIKITMRGENYIQDVRVVDTYFYESQRGYHVWKLISIPKPEHKQKPLPSNIGAFARSVFFPGWGHFYKKRYERGTLFLGIEVVAGVVAVSLWSNAGSNAETQQQALSMSILTIALHLLNVIDATTIGPDIQWY